jgi:signal transduction histidine kinase
VDAAEVARRVADRATSPPTVTVVGMSPHVSADPVRLEQLLQNLVDNARRHATSRVEISLGDHPTPSIAVADDGPGFAPDVLPRAFDRFTRGAPERGRDGGGAGLGLAIVAAIARAHGWSVSAENGGRLRGARVRVDLR